MLFRTVLDSFSSPCYPVSESLLEELGLDRVQQQKLLFGQHPWYPVSGLPFWVRFNILVEHMSFSTVVPSQRITE
jgi:hypothetical protein